MQFYLRLLLQELFSYYQIISKKENENYDNKLSFNIFFDRDKFHNLFFKKNILYSEIVDKEIYINYCNRKYEAL